MTIRARLYTAIVVTVCGLGLTVGAAIWGMSTLGDHFDRVQRAADDRALALQLKFGVTDFNGWQTAYGYDDGKSRPIFLDSVEGFRSDLARAKVRLRQRDEVRLLRDIGQAFDDFMRLDAVAWRALRAGRTAEVRRLFLGPEITNFQRAARGAQALAAVEDARAAREEKAFRDARKDALRFIIGAAILAALLVVILLVTAMDLARSAERALEQQEEPDA